MVSLFEVIGNNHGVTQKQVRQSLAHRRTSLDLAVILSFAVLYGLAARGMARQVWRRFPFHEGWIAGSVAVLITSLVVSAAGILLGEIWSEILEQFRLGNGHLSYRADRIPWHQHRLGLFVCGLVLFWVIAVLHCRAGNRRTEHHGNG